MSETQADINYPVYLGVWINRSLGGKITGSTITLTHRNGALLTAFLAVFVTFTGSRLWRILCFISYQLLQSHPSNPQDGLYHQRQAVLRNASDEKTGFLSLFYILLAWRQRAQKPLNRMLPIIGLSLLISITLMLASIFSSRISLSMGNEVLIASPNCGVPFSNSSVHPTAEQYAEIRNAWFAERITSHANYAQRCYSDSSEDSAETSSCTPFVKRKLASTFDRNASCPFKEQICRNKSGNLRIDTGYFSSQDLGLNLPISLAFKFRKILQCAPLESENYRKIAFYSQEKPYMQYFYGPSRIGSVNRPAPSFTYEIEQKSAEELTWRRLQTSPNADYSIETEACYIDDDGSCNADDSSFTPIRELMQTDGDVTLVFLSNDGIRYTELVNDEWFTAHQNTNDTIRWPGIHGQEHYYLSDEPASVLGCKEQYQSCDPTLPPERGCSSLVGYEAISFNSQTPKTKMEMALYWGLAVFPLQDILNALKSSSLTARFSLTQSVQAPLPADQWQREAENWHHIILASFQSAAIDQAVGPGNPEMLEMFWTKPNSYVERCICKNQKIISTAYTNFSAMWLFIVLIIGTLIISLELSLERIVLWLEYRNIIRTRSGEWFGNDTLQLQRMVHEELGLGNWEGCSRKAIPVTQKGQLLGIFDTTDSEHTRIVNPTSNIASQRPESATNIDESGDQQAAADESETLNKSHHSAASQEDNSHVNISYGSAGHCGINHNSNNHNHTSSHPVHPPDNIRPETTMAEPLEGKAATTHEPSKQHLLPQNETPAYSPDISQTQPDTMQCLT